MLKVTATCATTAVVLLAAFAVGHAAPLVNVYTSTDVGGLIIDGRWSESHFGGEGQIGNTVHAASWDTIALATQWLVEGPAINAAPILLDDTVNANGDGMRIYKTTYASGTLRLMSTGPWWDAANDGPSGMYVADIASYTHITTKHFLGGAEVLAATTTEVSLTGDFAAYPGREISLAVAVARPEGQGASPPAKYPVFLPTGTATSGAWGVAQKATVVITPEPATLSLVALGGALALLRRRRK